MRIKSWALFENYKEVSYGDYTDFTENKPALYFTKRESVKIEQVLGLSIREVPISLMNTNIPVRSNLSGAYIEHFDEYKRKSLKIYKFEDDWYGIFYINHRYGYTKSYICDQFDELVDCLTMIKIYFNI